MRRPDVGLNFDCRPDTFYRISRLRQTHGMISVQQRIVLLLKTNLPELSCIYVKLKNLRKLIF